MEAFPPEIIEEILSRLPVESLLCLKTVCKSWNSIIKTPAFIKSHLNKTLIFNSHPCLLKSSTDYLKKRKLSLYSAKIGSDDSQTDDRRLSFSMLNHPPDEFNYGTVFGSCNGVVSIYDYSKTNVLLYNPFTKSRRILPAKALPPSYKSEMGGRMLYGFGYDSKTDDYKVLRIAQGYRSPDYPFYESDHVCSVYSLNNNCWKSVYGIVSKQYYFFLYPYSDGVLFNETLHYIMISTTNELDNLKRPRKMMIVCFDLRTESFSLMDCPNHDDENNNNLMNGWKSYLTELDGCLCFMSMYFTHNIYTRQRFKFVRADLLVMKEYGNKESWSRVFSFSISDDQLRIACRTYNRVKPVVYSKDRQKILIDIDVGFMTGWFDLETKKFEELERHGLPAEYFDTGYFMGSLVSL